MKIFKCTNCDVYLNITEKHPEEDVCILCVAYCDLDDAEDYKQRYIAQDQIDSILENRTKLKSGQSVSEHCRNCKCLLYEDEQDGSLCENCVLNFIKG